MKITFILLFSIFCISAWSQTEQVNVYFELDKDVITTEAKKSLDQFLSIKNANGISIVGYADSTGNTSTNLKLSNDRAESVKKYLIDNGLDPKYISEIRGEGERSIDDSLPLNRLVIINFVRVETIRETDKLVDPGPDRSSDSSEVYTEVKEPDHISITRDGAIDQSTFESLKVGEILNLGGIEFQPGRHILTKRSEKPLKKLIQIMENNPDLRIEIQGHICCQADRDGLDKDTGTMNLSENRAKTVFNELVKAGIDRSRLTYKGYGPFRKLVVEFDDNSRQRNRRVSIQILEK